METSSVGLAPLKRNQSVIFSLSLASALLMLSLSILGLVIPDLFYPTPERAEAYLTNDLVNLLLGSPLFILGLFGIRRARLGGTLVLPGALIYVIYNYLAYLLGQPLSWSSVLYLILIVLALISLVLLLSELDHQAIMETLQGQVRDRVCGWILVLFGVVFIALAASQIWAGIRTGSIPPLGEQAVAVADILVSLGWVSGGILLVQGRPLGYSAGLGLLVAASSLFLGLILYFFLAPLLVGRPFDWMEVITVLVMGLIAFIPTGLYWKGVSISESSDSNQTRN